MSKREHFSGIVMTKFIKNHITINAIVLVSEQCFALFANKNISIFA